MSSRIAVIGTGQVAHCISKALAAKNHRIVIGTRDIKSERAVSLLKDVPNSTARSPQEAAKENDVIFLALPWNAVQESVKSLGDLKGKILVDMTNPVGKDFNLSVGTTSSAGELVQSWAPEAYVVKVRRISFDFADI